MTAADPTVRPLVALCLISTVALALAAQAVVAPVIICALLASYAFTGWPRLGRPRTYHALIIAVPFALWWRQYSEIAASNNYVPVGFLFIVGLYMCVLGAQHVLAHRRGGNLDYALACAIMGLALAGTAGRNPWFTPMLVGFAVLLLTHLRISTVGGGAGSGMIGPTLRHALALGFVIIATALIEVHVVRRLPELNQWAVSKLVSVSNRPTMGFSRSAQLGSIPETWRLGKADMQVALRVFAETSPEYLRGAAFDYYEPMRGRWSPIEEDRLVAPEATHWNRNVFDARAPTPVTPAAAGAPAADAQPLPADPPEQLALVYPAPEFSGTFFTPINTHRVAAFVKRARFGRAYTMSPDPETADLLGGYGYFAPASPQPPPNERDLHVPFAIRWRLMAIAQSIMPPDAPPVEKVRRLEAFTNEHFTYKLGIQLTGNKDPVLEFLEDIRAGHCEYFAASAALLLRTQGIPARYVTGFACRERGDGDDVWIVRRRDAHAWVEAYLPDRGWFIVEATPAGAMPTPVQTAGWDATAEWWSAYWSRLWHMLTHGGFTAMLGSAWAFIASLPQRLPTWAWLVLIGVGALWTFRGDIRNAWGRRERGHVPPHVRALRRKLTAAERLVARHGLTRPPSQSVTAFLARITDAADLPPTARSRATDLLSEYQRDRFRRV